MLEQAQVSVLLSQSNWLDKLQTQQRSLFVWIAMRKPYHAFVLRIRQVELYRRI